jgi:hypothetical protein
MIGRLVWKENTRGVVVMGLSFCSRYCVNRLKRKDVEGVDILKFSPGAGVSGCLYIF